MELPWGPELGVGGGPSPALARSPAPPEEVRDIFSPVPSTGVFPREEVAATWWLRGRGKEGQMLQAMLGGPPGHGQTPGGLPGTARDPLKGVEVFLAPRGM